MKIIYLYQNLASYHLTQFIKLAELENEIHIFQKKKIVNSFFKSKFFGKKIFIYDKKKYDYQKLKNFIRKINPNILVVAGWVDFLYLRLAITFKNKKIIRVVHADNIWNAKLKQQILRLFGLFNFLYLFFDKAWVHGPLQFEYVKKIGFKSKDIIFDHASADDKFFHKLYKENYNAKKKKYPKTFLFFSRREKIKGLETLMKSWKSLNLNNNINWELNIIGSGFFKISKTKLKNVKIFQHKSHEEMKKIIKNSGCFILPSIQEPWGVVVHEMSSAGLPLILSDTVGSRYTFLIHKKNGFVFEHGNYKSLERAMKNIMSLSDRELLIMSDTSFKLSSRISTNSSVHNLLSLEV